MVERGKGRARTNALSGRLGPCVEVLFVLAVKEPQARRKAGPALASACPAFAANTSELQVQLDNLVAGTRGFPLTGSGYRASCDCEKFPASAAISVISGMSSSQ